MPEIPRKFFIHMEGRSLAVIFDFLFLLPYQSDAKSCQCPFLNTVTTAAYFRLLLHFSRVKSIVSKSMFSTLHKSEQVTLFLKTHTCLWYCLWNEAQAFQDLVPASLQAYFLLLSVSILLLLNRELHVVLNTYQLHGLITMSFDFSLLSSE